MHRTEQKLTTAFEKLEVIITLVLQRNGNSFDGLTLTPCSSAYLQISCYQFYLFINRTISRGSHSSQRQRVKVSLRTMKN